MSPLRGSRSRRCGGVGPPRHVQPIPFSISRDGSEEWFGPARLAPAAGLPRALKLGQNHPNPSNPATTFTYSLPRTGPVDLGIFDARGRRIAVLAEGAREAGTHRATWD